MKKLTKEENDIKLLILIAKDLQKVLDRKTLPTLPIVSSEILQVLLSANKELTIFEVLSAIQLVVIQNILGEEDFQSLCEKFIEEKHEKTY